MTQKSGLCAVVAVTAGWPNSAMSGNLAGQITKERTRKNGVGFMNIRGHPRLFPNHGEGINMRLYAWRRALMGAVLIVGFALVAVDYLVVTPTEYRFELVEAQPAGPGKINVALRLVHVQDMKPVAGAVLLKANMGPAMVELPHKVRLFALRSA